jgi:hypothetical protein
MKKNQRFNISYMCPVTVPIFMMGFKFHSPVVIAAASILLVFFVIGGIVQGVSNKKKLV